MTKCRANLGEQLVYCHQSSERAHSSLEFSCMALFPRIHTVFDYIVSVEMVSAAA